MDKNNNYLAHYGVKGMRWKKGHAYTSIVGGEYVYDRDQLSNQAAQMKKQGYTNDQIRNSLRASMAQQRSANAAAGGNFSGAADRAQQRMTQQNNQAAVNKGKYADEIAKARADAAQAEIEKKAQLEVTNKERAERLAKEKAEKKAQKEEELKYGPSKKVKHAMYDVNNYLEHHGILGQRWGVRRFQNADGTLTPAGVKRYTKWDSKEGKRVLNRKGKKMYNAQMKKEIKQVQKENNKLIKRRSVLSDEEISRLTTRFANEKKLNEAYANSTIGGRFKEQFISNLSKKGADALSDIAINTAINIGTAAINKKLNSNIGNTRISEFINADAIKKANNQLKEATRKAKEEQKNTEVTYNTSKDKYEAAQNRYNMLKSAGADSKTLSSAYEKLSSAEDSYISAKHDYDARDRRYKDSINSAKNQNTITMNDLYINASSDLDKFVSSSKSANLDLAKSYFKQRDKK